MISQPVAGRGRVSGALLILLGAWGALVPFVGPYFGYAYTPDKTWAYTSGRLMLSVLPGALVFLAGVLILISDVPAAIGGFFAAVGGAWFVVGAEVMAVVAPSYTPGSPVVPSGAPFGPDTMRLLENIGFYSGLGVVIVFLGALALGKAAVARLSRGAYSEPASEVTEEHQLGGTY
ncbi:MAG: hypothetical protein LBV34_06715 [Nocardiopsaceae bacterium]|jgi:hypothetical protein|nr:hypothetical protein [Nocardiopsaceae bacterium]